MKKKPLTAFNKGNSDVAAPEQSNFVKRADGSISALVYDQQTVCFSLPTVDQFEETLVYLNNLLNNHSVGTFQKLSPSTYNSGDTFSKGIPLSHVEDDEFTGSETQASTGPSLAVQLNSLLGVNPFTLELTPNVKVENVLRVLGVVIPENNHTSHKFLEVTVLLFRA